MSENSQLFARALPRINPVISQRNQQRLFIVAGSIFNGRRTLAGLKVRFSRQYPISATPKYLWIHVNQPLRLD